jgi:hypothetical protein
MVKDTADKPVRDDFHPDVIKALARRAAFVCSNPDCRAFTIAPSAEDPSKDIFGSSPNRVGNFCGSSTSRCWFRPGGRRRARVTYREFAGNDVVVDHESLEEQQQLLFSRPCETARHVFEPREMSFSP